MHWYLFVYDQFCDHPGDIRMTARKSAIKRHTETREQRTARIRAEVATWPRLTPQRQHELARLLRPAFDRIAADAATNERG